MRGEATVSNDKLIATELMETGRVKIQVYKHYLRSVSLNFAIPAVFLLVAMQGKQIKYKIKVTMNTDSHLNNLPHQLPTGLVMGSSVWLSEWSSRSAANQTDAKRTRDLYLGVYGAFGLAQGNQTTK